jgi:hypothetical protein
LSTLKVLSLSFLFVGVVLGWLNLRGSLRDSDRLVLLEALERPNVDDGPPRIELDHPGVSDILRAYPPPAGHDVVAVSRAYHTPATPNKVPLAEGSVTYVSRSGRHLAIVPFSAFREWCSETPYGWLAWALTLVGALLAAAESGIPALQKRPRSRVKRAASDRPRPRVQPELQHPVEAPRELPRAAPQQQSPPRQPVIERSVPEPPKPPEPPQVRRRPVFIVEDRQTGKSPFALPGENRIKTSFTLINRGSPAHNVEIESEKIYLPRRVPWFGTNQSERLSVSFANDGPTVVDVTVRYFDGSDQWKLVLAVHRDGRVSVSDPTRST